jgi:hypothetical protein
MEPLPRKAAWLWWRLRAWPPVMSSVPLVLKSISTNSLFW